MKLAALQKTLFARQNLADMVKRGSQILCLLEAVCLHCTLGPREATKPKTHNTYKCSLRDTNKLIIAVLRSSCSANSCWLCTQASQYIRTQRWSACCSLANCLRSSFKMGFEVKFNLQTQDFKGSEITWIHFLLLIEQ